ncbi:MAG: alpha-L-fucosidase [Pseudoxanthomonas sp.]
MSLPASPLSRRQLLCGVGAAGLTALLPPMAVAATAVVAKTSALAALRPRPTSAQLAWQREELAMFVHFTVNTFTDREWGQGDESPDLFDPAALDARQWARTAKRAGFGSLILTAKHHDGFCLWPTATTEHSVRSSPWKNGKGDVVREFVDACGAEGLGVGLYLSPWDRNAASYGDSPRYNDFYLAQLTELLTNYGPLVELWFDGANGEGPNGRRQVYDWPRIHATVRRLQPNAVIFSDTGPDARWIGNETGAAGATCWASVDPARVERPGASEPWVGEALQQGDPYGSVWRPGESDVSIRPGWFWHESENEKARSAEGLLDLYFTSVGRNSKLLLNVPPTRQGLFHERDVRSLEGFGDLRRRMLAHDAMAGATATASGHEGRRIAAHAMDGDDATWWQAPKNAREAWIAFDLPEGAEFDVVSLEEAIEEGQHIAQYRVDIWRDGGWSPLTWGTTIGCRRLHQVPLTRTPRLRVRIEYAYDAPRLRRVALLRDPARNRTATHG